MNKTNDSLLSILQLKSLRATTSTTLLLNLHLAHHHSPNSFSTVNGSVKNSSYAHLTLLPVIKRVNLKKQSSCRLVEVPTALGEVVVAAALLEENQHSISLLSLLSHRHLTPPSLLNLLPPMLLGHQQVLYLGPCQAALLPVWEGEELQHPCSIALLPIWEEGLHHPGPLS